MYVISGCRICDESRSEGCVTGMMLMPWTYSNSDPNHVEAVTSRAPTLPTMRLAEKTLP